MAKVVLVRVVEGTTTVVERVHLYLLLVA